MKQAVCEGCGQSFPMGETFKVVAKVLCRACTENYLQQHAGQVPENAVSVQADPTVCVECKKDFGRTELPKLAGVPVCEACGERFRNRPFPMWVKAGFAGLVVITVVSFAWNWRFMSGYYEARSSLKAFQVGDFEKASRLMTAASQHVPENRELSVLADLNKGLLLAKEDKPAEAVPLLKRARGAMPQAKFLDLLILHCEMSMAFDAKNYDGFLEKVRALQRAQGDTAITLGSLASAYACKYAVTGDESFKKQALEFLQRAGQAKDRDAKDHAVLEQRILHRLETREIIDGKEFKKRYPDGWKKEEKEAPKEVPA